MRRTHWTKDGYHASMREGREEANRTMFYLRDLREESGWTQLDVLHHLDHAISPNTFRRYENGFAVPQLDLVYTWCSVLGARINIEG